MLLQFQQEIVILEITLSLHYQQRARMLGLEPRTSLTQYLLLLTALLTQPPTLNLSPQEAGLLFPLPLPDPCITRLFWLHQSLGLLAWAASLGQSLPSCSPASLTAIFSLDSFLSLVSPLFFLPYIYNKNLHTLGVVMSSFLYFIFFSFMEEFANTIKLENKTALTRTLVDS